MFESGHCKIPDPDSGAKLALFSWDVSRRIAMPNRIDALAACLVVTTQAKISKAVTGCLRNKLVASLSSSCNKAVRLPSCYISLLCSGYQVGNKLI